MASKNKNTKYRVIYLKDVKMYAYRGFKNSEIAAMLGVHKQTFKDWVKKYPALKKVLRAARGGLISGTKKEKEFDFADYVYQTLPEKVQKLWLEIHALEKAKSPIERVEAVLSKHGIRIRQYLFIHALVCYNFNVSKAMGVVNVSYTTLESWKKKDSDFEVLLTTYLVEAKKDIFEQALIKSARRGVPSSIALGVKTLAKDRGYGEQIDVNLGGGLSLQSATNLDDLKMPLEIRKDLLRQIRERDAKEDKEK